MNFRQLMEAIDDAKKVTEKKDTYELEIEMDGFGIFRLDIKDLDKFMIKIQAIGKALGGDGN